MTLSAMNIIISIFVFVLGTCLFSFLNVVIYRLPQKLSWVKGRSFCPKCKNTLKPYDMVPILSWIFLGGKCRFCKEKISARYPLTELLGGILALGCAVYYNVFSGECMSVLKAIDTFGAFMVLTVVTLIDHDTMEIPDCLHIALAVFAVAAVFIFPEVTVVSRLIGAVCVSLPLLIIALIIPGAFGGGDMKLMFVAGFFLGWKLCLTAFFFGVILGGFYGIYLLASKKLSKGGHFAFGPFLCIGIAAAVFWGEALLEWYITSFF